MRTSALLYFSRATVSLLALCLLITPLCAARCALATCLPASAPTHSAGSCHHSSAKSHAATSIAAIAPASCQSSDSLFDALPTQQTLSLKSVTWSAVQLPFLISGLSNAASRLLTTLAPFASNSSPGLSLPSSPTPLRL